MSEEAEEAVLKSGTVVGLASDEIVKGFLSMRARVRAAEAMLESCVLENYALWEQLSRDNGLSKEYGYQLNYETKRVTVTRKLRPWEREEHDAMAKKVAEGEG